MHIYELLKELVVLYWLDGVIVISIVGGIFLLIKNDKQDIAYRCIYDLVVRAEHALGSGTGELKYTYVVSEIYTKLPISIRFFFSKKDIDSFIELAVESLKQYLMEEIDDKPNE